MLKGSVEQKHESVQKTTHIKMFEIISLKNHYTQTQARVCKTYLSLPNKNIRLSFP